jgi:hypothetical protein
VRLRERGKGLVREERGPALHLRRVQNAIGLHAHAEARPDRDVAVERLRGVRADYRLAVVVASAKDEERKSGR